MKTKQKAFIFCLVAITLIPSLMVFALNEGDAAGTRAAYGISCVLCRIANLIFMIIAALAALVIILAGLKWLTSGDDPGARNSAKTAIVSAFVGIIIVFIAVFVVAWVMQGLGGSFEMVRVEDWINSNECDNQCTLARGYGEATTTEEKPAEPEDPTLSVLSAGEKEECDVDECGGTWIFGVENCDPYEICKNGDCVFSEADCCSQQCGEAECPTLSGVVSCNPSFERCSANEAGTACECRIVENNPCCSDECGEKTCLYPDGKAYECWGSEKCIARDDLKGCDCAAIFNKWGSSVCDGSISLPGEERPLSEEQPERTDDQKLSVLSVDPEESEEECYAKDCEGGILGWGAEDCLPHEVCRDGECVFARKCCSKNCGGSCSSDEDPTRRCFPAQRCVANEEQGGCECKIDEEESCCSGKCGESFCTVNKAEDGRGFVPIQCGSAEKCVVDSYNVGCECKVFDDESCCSDACGETICVYGDGSIHACAADEKCTIGGGWNCECLYSQNCAA